MTELSPAAQAVLDAVVPYPVHEAAIAAALRAAADQVVPECKCNTRTDRGYQRTLVRRELYAIAAELEGPTRNPAT